MRTDAHELVLIQRELDMLAAARLLQPLSERDTLRYHVLLHVETALLHATAA